VPDTPDEGVPRSLRLAGLVAAIEGAGVLAAGVVLAVKTIVQTPNNLGRALLGTAFALLGGLVLLLLARAVARADGWARSPLVVLQILALPIGYTMTFDSGQPAYGIPVLLLAVAELYLLFTPESREALERR
jgi:hypothetical protein